jgi:SAM-dependent methyltransferase
VPVPDLPRQFAIREDSHRILNAYTPEKLAVLGNAIGLRPGTTILDLACGKGELLCTWARDHGVTGTGVDISTVFLAAAHDRADELGVADAVSFVHADAATYLAAERVDVGCCVGATWIGDGVPGTLRLLESSLNPGGMLLVGEPYWRLDPPDEETVVGAGAVAKEDFRSLAGTIELFAAEGWDTVEMVLADQDSWDRSKAAQWLNIRRWLDSNPDDELAPEMREELTNGPARYARYRRDYLGWGVFALMRR